MYQTADRGHRRVLHSESDTTVVYTMGCLDSIRDWDRNLYVLIICACNCTYIDML